MALRKQTKSDIEPELDQELARKCEQIIGWRVASMQYPGGKKRDSVKLILKKSAPVYASRRSRKKKADTERLILNTLHKAGENVPKLIGSDGQKLLIQEDIPGKRLTQAIHNRSDKNVFRYLDSALQSLGNIHQTGSAQGLDAKLGLLGDSDNWLHGLLERPSVLGEHLSISAPELDRNVLMSMLKIRNPRFVKWDSRPGNAIVRPDKKVFWIDWEHSGCRNRLDDMVWLLADEFVPVRSDAEERLLDLHLPVFADDLTEARARQYFYAMGVFHSTVRLGLILKYKKDGGWWSFRKCLEGDKAGVTLKNALRLCERGEVWAAKTAETRPLSNWFKQVGEKLEQG